MIDLSAKVRDKMDLLEKDFGGKYSLQMAYDASKELEDELNQTLFRTLLTILILLIFVFSGEPGFPLFVDYRRFFSC